MWKQDLGASADQACRLDPPTRPTAGRCTRRSERYRLQRPGWSAAMTPRDTRGSAGGYCCCRVARDEAGTKAAERHPRCTDVRAYRPAVADDAGYEYTSVQVFRGSEAATIAKWRTDGWELDSRDQGLLRTDLTFRRVRPATLGSRVRAAFGQLEPKAQRGVLAASGGLLILVIVGGVVAGVQAGGGTPVSAASATDAAVGTSPSEKPSERALRAPESITPAEPTIESPAPRAPTPPPETPKPQAPASVAPNTQAPAFAPAPAPAPQAVAPPAPQPPPSTSAYYKNCDAVRAAGADPIRTGDPGYSRKLDRDGDGVGCE